MQTLLLLAGAALLLSSKSTSSAVPSPYPYGPAYPGYPYPQPATDHTVSDGLAIVKGAIDLGVAAKGTYDKLFPDDDDDY